VKESWSLTVYKAHHLFYLNAMNHYLPGIKVNHCNTILVVSSLFILETNQRGWTKKLTGYFHQTTLFLDTAVVIGLAKTYWTTLGYYRMLKK